MYWGNLPEEQENTLKNPVPGADAVKLNLSPVIDLGILCNFIIGAAHPAYPVCYHGYLPHYTASAAHPADPSAPV